MKSLIRPKKLSFSLKFGVPIVFVFLLIIMIIICSHSIPIYESITCQFNHTCLRIIDTLSVESLYTCIPEGTYVNTNDTLAVLHRDRYGRQKALIAPYSGVVKLKHIESNVSSNIKLVVLLDSCKQHHITGMCFVPVNTSVLFKRTARINLHSGGDPCYSYEIRIDRIVKMKQKALIKFELIIENNCWLSEYGTIDCLIEKKPLYSIIINNWKSKL